MPDNQGLGGQARLVNIRFENLLDKAKLLARIRIKKPELNLYGVSFSTPRSGSVSKL